MKMQIMALVAQALKLWHDADREADANDEEGVDLEKGGGLADFLEANGVAPDELKALIEEHRCDEAGIAWAIAEPARRKEFETAQKKKAPKKKAS